jgi:hypothetical protein
MRRYVGSAGSIVLVLSFLCTTRSMAADGTATAGAPSLNDLSMEVAALQAFHQFRLTSAQLGYLRKLAKETAAEPSEREAAKASASFRETLMALRNALLADDDDDLIDQLQEELDELTEKEKPELDDGIEVTDAARLGAPELVRFLSGRQVAFYLASHAEEIPEPAERLREALGMVRKLDPAEWKQVRTAVSDEIARGVAGLDADKAAQVADQVVQLLIQARAMRDEEFKAQRVELEKTAREIVGKLGPLDVLRHFLAQDLAELLSNPLLGTAIDARLKR